MGLTTVGWNAEVMPCQNTAGGVFTKADLNLVGETATAGCPTIASALNTGVAVQQSTFTNYLGQFNANVIAFKTRYKPPAGSNFFKVYGSFCGARRQAIMTKVRVAPGGSGWEVRVQLFNPWYGNYAGDTQSSIDVTGHMIKVYDGNGTTVLKTYSLPVTSIGNKTTWDTGTISVSGGTVGKVTLEATVTGLANPLIIDQIEALDLGSIGTGTTKKRLVGVYDEPRTSDNSDDASCMVTVLYVKKWTDTSTATWDTTPDGGLTGVTKGTGIPIRFPHSVPPNDAIGADKWDTKADGYGPLPPYYSAADAPAGKPKAFKAFLRVGDLNQVLCPNTEAEAAAGPYWPWITRVANASSQSDFATNGVTYEKAVKWDWCKDDAAAKKVTTAKPVYDATTPANSQYNQFNAANILCVDSPWLDSYDNDGDGKKDDQETALDKANGRFCGKETRVAGRINLNTATDQALKALGNLTLTPGTIDPTAEQKYLFLTNTATARPLTSPAEILRTLTTASTDPECLGPLEKRDFWYTRISNIATIRSDTFSIYGTVQFVYPAGRDVTTGQNDLTKMKIGRTRRFWALVDRSPSLCFSPTSTTNFIRPRIMNFQWIE
jgi:hypothetical protein